MKKNRTINPREPFNLEALKEEVNEEIIWGI